MIRRWISLVPSKMVKLVEVRTVSAGRWPAERTLVSTNSAPDCRQQLPRAAIDPPCHVAPGIATLFGLGPSRVAQLTVSLHNPDGFIAAAEADTNEQ